VHLTQPALSRSIQALEEELGQTLVDRIGKRLELSAAGRELLGRAQALIADAAEFEAQARRLASGQGGQLRVGLGSGPAVLLMDALLDEAARRGPAWRMELAQGAADLLLHRLRARQLDALVVDLRSLPPAADLFVDTVHELPGAYLVRPGHPLLARVAQQGALPYAALADWPLASTPLSDDVARLLIARYGPAANPAQAVALRCDDLGRLIRLTQRSEAVLLAVRACAPDLVELPLDPPIQATARLGLVTLARRGLPPAVGLLRELMAQHLGPAPR
jgi:DNA-binding transcriptional LysR family regulator